MSDEGGGEAGVTVTSGSGPLRVVGPIPVAFDSANIETTGFPVLDVVAGDIVIGWGLNLVTPWAGDGVVIATGSIYVTDSDGTVVVNEGSNDFFNTATGDSDGQNLSEVFDGWTLILNDTQLVLVVIPNEAATAGAADLYIVVMHPVAP